MYSDIVLYSRIITQKYIQREIIRICNNIITESFEDITDVFELHQQSLANSNILLHIYKNQKFIQELKMELYRYYRK